MSPSRPSYSRVWLTFLRNSLVREMTFRGNFLITILTRAFVPEKGRVVSHSHGRPSELYVENIRTDKRYTVDVRRIAGIGS